MSTRMNPAALLASLLNGLSNGTFSVLEVPLDPSRSLEDQLDEVGAQLDAKIDAARAEHRKTCPTCAAAYEARQEQTKPAPEPEPEPEPTKQVPKLRSIGFMAFDGDKPIDKTFDADRDVVAEGVKQFLEDPMVQMLRTITGGRGFPDMKIKRVFVRDDL